MEGIRSMKKYFYLDESPFYKNKYVIQLNHDLFLFPNGTSGSFNVIVARVLNLTYADYLRYARDKLGAELIGKNKRYVMAYFENNQATMALIKLLNTRMEYIMHEHKYPFNYSEDKDGNVIRTPFTEVNENNS